MLVGLTRLHALQLSSYSQIKVMIHVFQLSGKNAILSERTC